MQSDLQNYKLDSIVNIMKERNISILGLSETHWTPATEDLFEHNGYAVLRCCRTDNIKRQGVAIILEKSVADSLLEYDLTSERMITIKLGTKNEAINIIQVYAPDSGHSDDESDLFLQALQQKVEQCPRKEQLVLMGDLNAKVGDNHHDTLPNVVGHYGLGSSNDRGWRLLQFCALNNLTITNTMFTHSNLRRATWFSPDGKTQNQIDYIITKQCHKGNMKNARSYHSADIGSDHSLVIAKFETLMKPVHKPKKYST